MAGNWGLTAKNKSPRQTDKQEEAPLLNPLHPQQTDLDVGLIESHGNVAPIVNKATARRLPTIGTISVLGELFASSELTERAPFASQFGSSTYVGGTLRSMPWADYYNALVWR